MGDSTSGADLFRRGDYYEAHEAWEKTWRKTSPGPGRDRLQAWIMVSGIGVHLKMSRLAPARRLAARAIELLAHFDPLTREWLTDFSESDDRDRPAEDWLKRLISLVPPEL